MEKGRGSSEGRGPSVGQCWSWGHERSHGTRFPPNSMRALPILLLVLKEGAHLEEIWKGRGQGGIQTLHLNRKHNIVPIPPVHSQLCQHCHTVENISTIPPEVSINHRSHWAQTDRTGWVLFTTYQTPCFLKVTKNRSFPLMPEQVSNLAEVSSGNSGRSILAALWVILIFFKKMNINFFKWTATEITVHMADAKNCDSLTLSWGCYIYLMGCRYWG